MSSRLIQRSHFALLEQVLAVSPVVFWSKADRTTRCLKGTKNSRGYLKRQFCAGKAADKPWEGRESHITIPALIAVHAECAFYCSLLRRDRGGLLSRSPSWSHRLQWCWPSCTPFRWGGETDSVLYFPLKHIFVRLSSVLGLQWNIFSGCELSCG